MSSRPASATLVAPAAPPAATRPALIWTALVVVYLAAEPITAQVLLGGAVIVAGVAVVVSTERPRRPVDGAATDPARR
jgi:drug/metabolite transporter (DMT)-like permease